jgi:alcohol dehydrogenase (cytochrome c)
MRVHASRSALIRSVCAALAFAGPGSGQSVQDDWRTVTDARLLDPADGDWLSYRRTYDVHGFSPLEGIDRTNVEDLRPVWAYSVQDNSRWVPTPIVANGLMYVAEGSGRVLAFDAVSGEIRWIHRRTFPEDIRASQAYPNHRGVSVYGDRVYWGTADSFLVALDARTGEQVWEVRTGDYHKGEGHSHPPLIADGKVILGFLGGERELRGSMTAYDAASGDLLWRTYTVPAPGEPGSESWSESDMPPLGGPTWGTASYDPELGLVYFGTGQPTPWASTLRGPGDALYTNSILAVDIASGGIRWYFQVVPADNWDMDSPYESTLVDLEIDGVIRRALIHTSKIGWGVVLDRVTGEFIRSFRTAYDNIVTGWTDAGRPLFNPEVIPAPRDVDSGRVFEVCPHYHGARNLNAPSYDPTTGLYYLGINNSCMDAVFVSQEYERGRAYSGMTATVKSAPGYDYVGEFVAFDPATGERRWTYRQESGAAMSASALATAGGIVFGGTSDRYFFALDSETGERLWQLRLNGDVSGAPVTFAVDGRQYVAVGAGGRIAQTTSYAGLTGTDIPLGTGVIWVFALPDRSAARTGDSVNEE